MHFGIIIFFLLIQKFNTKVATLDKGLTEHSGAAVINLVLEGYF